MVFLILPKYRLARACILNLMTLHSGTSCNRDAMEILAGIIIILTHAVAVNNDCGISFTF